MVVSIHSVDADNLVILAHLDVLVFPDFPDNQVSRDGQEIRVPLVPWVILDHTETRVIKVFD